MAKSVWKYPVGADAFKANMPADAKPLCVQMQNESPQLWALVDVDRPTTTRHFLTVGTGHPIDPELALKYVDSFQMADGLLIFHVFEVL